LGYRPNEEYRHDSDSVHYIVLKPLGSRTALGLLVNDQGAQDCSRAPFVHIVVFVFCGHFNMLLCWWSKRKKEIALAISFEVS